MDPDYGYKLMYNRAIGSPREHNNIPSWEDLDERAKQEIRRNFDEFQRIVREAEQAGIEETIL